MAFRPRSVAAATRAQTLTRASLASGVRNVQAFAARRRTVLMPDLKLTLACWDYDRTRPLIDGRVKPAGIDLDIEILRPRQAFQRMLDNKEFEVSELSLASYAALKGRGECPFVAVPVALSKIFRHSCIYVRAGAGIDRPQDLKGKRVGTSQWSSTGLVFMRGMLQHDYGVKPQDMHWFMGGLNSFVEPPLIALNLPNDIRLDFDPLARRQEGVRLGLWRRRFRQEHRAGPAYRRHRSRFEVARMPHRRRRQCGAARRDDGRAGNAVGDGRTRQCVARYRSGVGGGRTHRSRRQPALAGGEPRHRESLRLAEGDRFRRRRRSRPTQTA